MNKALKLFWVGLFLEVTGWNLLVPAFNLPNWLGLLPLVAGAALVGLSLWSGAPTLSLKARFGYGLASLLVMAFAPYPVSLGGMFILCGLALAWLMRRSRPGAGFGFGILLTGIICLFQGALLPLLTALGSRFHELPVLAPVVCGLFRCFGFAAARDTNTVFVQTGSSLQDYAVNGEYFGWFFLVNAACGLAAWMLVVQPKPRVRHFLLFVVAAMAYALARYFLLALLYLDLHVFALFWNPWIVAASHFPFFACLAGTRWLGLDAPVAAEAPPSRLGRAQALGAFAIAAAAFCLVATWGWEDPGHRKQGRLLLEESHSQWEKTDRPYDTEWYGEESGYNYYCLANLLEHYYRVRHSSSGITPALLRDCDILIIKTPTAGFTAEEIEAIERFVEDGGGLLLIGDHTNVFGTSKYLNAIAHRFGLHYNYDATYDVATGGLSVFKPPPRLPHPVVQRLPPFLFGTSCTLQVPPGARVPINGYALRVAGHDYSAKSFFTSQTEGPYVAFGLFPQLAVVKYKRGRVAAFTDSTVFSNFWMFIPGKPELLLGCTEWLNRRNAFSALPRAAAVLALLLGVVGVWCWRLAWRESVPLLMAACAVGVFAGVGAAGASNRAAYPTPVPHTQLRSIAFDRQWSHFELPDVSLMREPNADFSTLYVWAQRVGVVPRVCPRLADSVRQNDGIVLIHPSGAPAAADVLRLRTFVEQGGVLFIFESSRNKHSNAGQIMTTFGLALGDALPQSQTLTNAAGQVAATNRPVRVTKGGNGLLFAAGDQPVLSLKRFGRGTVIFSGDAELFANSSLGVVSQVPDETQRRLYNIVFQMYREVLR